MGKLDILDRDWIDISSEEYRLYDFGELNSVRIEKPQKLNISDSGGHRILDGEDKSHYIPSGWIHIEWKANPHFVA